jgi:hypothetical protein
MYDKQNMDPNEIALIAAEYQAKMQEVEDD